MLRFDHLTRRVLLGSTCLFAGLASGCGATELEGVGSQKADEPGRNRDGGTRSEPEPESGEPDAGDGEPEPDDAVDDDVEPEPQAPSIPIAPVDPAPVDPAPGPMVPEPEMEPEPAAEPTVEPDPPVVPDPPPAGVLWQFIETETEAYVHNLLGSEDRVAITSTVETYLDLVPWSPDGTELVQLVEGEAVFYDLGMTATVTGSFPAPGYDRVVGWIPGVGPLLAGTDAQPALIAMRPDGTQFPVSTEMPTGTPSVSPDGSEVVWSTVLPTTAVGDPTVFLSQHFSVMNGESGAAEVFLEHEGSPILDNRWSSDSRFLAFGIAGDPSGDGGIHVWQKGSAASVKVSPDGTSYSPLFQWSKDGTRLVFFVSTGEGNALYTVAMTDMGPAEPQLIGQGPDMAPAYWNGYGSLVYGDLDGAWLLPVNADGTHGEAMAFPSYATCGVAWLNESAFVHTGCTLGNPLLYGEVANGAVTTIDLNAAPPGRLLLSPDQRCLLEWSPETLQVGSADPMSYSPNVIDATGVVSYPSFAEGGQSLVYIALGVSIQHYTLEDCAPGERLQRVASGIVTDAVVLGQ